MKKFVIATAALAGLLATPAFAHSNFSIGIDLGGPTYYAPPPPPVYYAPQAVAYYPPAPAYYAPRAYYAPVSYYYPTAYYGGYYGPRHYRHHGYWR